MPINWPWLVGFIPYSVKRQKTKNEQILTVKALFWRLTICWRKGQCLWEIYVPFIEENLRQ